MNKAIAAGLPAVKLTVMALTIALSAILYFVWRDAPPIQTRSATPAASGLLPTPPGYTETVSAMTLPAQGGGNGQGLYIIIRPVESHGAKRR